MARPRPIQVRTGRHPYEVAVLAAALAVGLALVITDLHPRSVQTAMPAPVQALWELQLAVGGVVGLLGCYWPGHLTAALGVEMCGQIILGTGMTMYTIALVAVSGLAAIAAGSFVGALAVAAWWRAIQIWWDLRRMGRAAESGQIKDVPLLFEER